MGVAHVREDQGMVGMIGVTHIDLPGMNDGSSHGGIGHMGMQIEAWFVGPCKNRKEKQVHRCKYECV